MPFAVYDRVAESSTTTGTGDFTLDGALTGYQTFDATVGVVGTCYYLIEAVDGSGVATGDWETGVGTLTASTTLERTAVIASSNAGAAVNFAAGTKHVHVTAAARQIAYSGGAWKLSADLTSQNLTTLTSINWDQQFFTTENVTPFHESVTNPSRITLDGDRYADSIIQITAQIMLSLETASDAVEIEIVDDLGSIIGHNRVSTTATTAVIQCTSRPYQMSTTTRNFEIKVKTSSDVSVTVVAAESWVQLEVKQ